VFLACPLGNITSPESSFCPSNISKNITQEVIWNITDSLVASLDANATLNATKEGSTQITATLENITSQTLSLNVIKIINGHTLPPMPDKTLNDSTLLGIDSNSNGVRDDVERYLLIKYKDHHKIVSEIALQSGRAFQIVLEHPENARETIKVWNAAKSCNRYFKDDADYYGDEILVNHKIVDYVFKELQLNTKERVSAYLEYNHNLSGGVYKLAISSKPLERLSNSAIKFSGFEIFKSDISFNEYR